MGPRNSLTSIFGGPGTAFLPTLTTAADIMTGRRTTRLSYWPVCPDPDSRNERTLTAETDVAELESLEACQSSLLNREPSESL